MNLEAQKKSAGGDVVGVVVQKEILDTMEPMIDEDVVEEARNGDSMAQEYLIKKYKKPNQKKNKKNPHYKKTIL